MAVVSAEDVFFTLQSAAKCGPGNYIRMRSTQLTLYTLLCQMAFLRAKTISVHFGIVFIALVHKDYHTSGTRHQR